MNTKAKIKATLFIVLFLLVIAVIVYIMTGSGERQNYSGFDYTTPVPAGQTYPPVYAPAVQPQLGAEQPPQQAPAVIATPEPTPAPTPAPPPTPAPTPTPEPLGLTVAGGQFFSQSGSPLNIHADWKAVTDSSNTVAVTVTVYADHYSIDYTSFQGLHITLGGEKHSLYAAEMHSAQNTLQTTELGNYTFSVPLSPGEMKMTDLQVSWEFNGYYGKDNEGNPRYLPTLDCGGSITLTR